MRSWAKGEKDKAEAAKEEVRKDGELLDELSKKQTELSEELTRKMMVIPQMIDPSVPIGRDDSENVEVQRFGGEPKVPDFEVPYHTDIMESFGGIDMGGCWSCCRKRFLLSHRRHSKAS